MKTLKAVLSALSLVIAFTPNAQSKMFWEHKTGDIQRYSQVAQSVIRLFKNHSLVALDEGHHTSKVFHGFLLTLLTEKKLPLVINDIVV